MLLVKSTCQLFWVLYLLWVCGLVKFLTDLWLTQYEPNYDIDPDLKGLNEKLNFKMM
jgi:hypothetical protein